MRMILHVGPHKTGTTTLQVGLRQLFSSAQEGRPWFPSFDSGPGHHELAEKFALYTRKDRYNYILENSKKFNISDLILSSEDFSKLDVSKLKEIAEYIRPDELLIIISMSPIARRICAIWQEMIKHGYLCALNESIEEVNAFPGVMPDLLQRIVGGFKGNRPSIIIANPNKPEIIWKNFQSATGVDVSELADQAASYNMSLGMAGTEILRSLNMILAARQASHEVRSDATRMLVGLFDSNPWRNLIENDEIRLPDAWSDRVKAVILGNICTIRRLRNNGELAVHGRLSDIVDFDYYFRR